MPAQNGPECGALAYVLISVISLSDMFEQQFGGSKLPHTPRKHRHVDIHGHSGRERKQCTCMTKRLESSVSQVRWVAATRVACVWHMMAKVDLRIYENTCTHRHTNIIHTTPLDYSTLQCTTSHNIT